MSRSKIEWLARTGTVPVSWNPVTGCTKISEGCAHCYAERMSKRLAGRFGYPADEPFAVTLHEDRLDEPLRWRKPRTVFVCSMGDLFHEDVPLDYVVDVFDLMARCEQHTFIVLTKRADRMLEMMESIQDWEYKNVGWSGRCPSYLIDRPQPLPLPNVWGLVTAENQKQLDKRVPLLLQCPFVVRGISIEPMLGAMDCEGALGFFYRDASSGEGIEVPGVDWIIAGAETGPGARPMDPDWARDVRDQCAAAGVPFFFKKAGQGKPTPDDLAIREWPGEAR
jgi:protein gp37